MRAYIFDSQWRGWDGYTDRVFKMDGSLFPDQHPVLPLCHCNYKDPDVFPRKRRAAIEALSTVLWGFTTKETLNILNRFFPE